MRGEGFDRPIRRSPEAVRHAARHIVSWRRESNGAAAAEFALVLPVLVMIWIGGFEASQAVSTYRKVTDTTAQLANLASREVQMSQSQAQADMSAVAQIMAPYSTANLKIRLSEINVDGSIPAKITVTWSQGYNGATTYTDGQTFTALPSSLIVANTSYVLVETSYTYNATVGGSYIGYTIPMASQLYMSPREISTIPCTDC